MHINPTTATDEELVRFFIWDGLSPEKAIVFVIANFRPDMLPFTEDKLQELKEYDASFSNHIN